MMPCGKNRMHAMMLAMNQTMLTFVRMLRFFSMMEFATLALDRLVAMLSENAPPLPECMRMNVIMRTRLIAQLAKMTY